MRKLYEKAINYIHIVDEETRDRYKRKFMWYDNGLLPLDVREPNAMRVSLVAACGQCG